jgi:hypothetical protein
MAVALGEQERRVVGSINELLERMEEQRRNSALQLKESKVSAPCMWHLMRLSFVRPVHSI